MRIIEDISELKTVKSGCVLSIGNYDGVHLGHKEILDFGKKKAVQRSTELVAITFEPHPVAILYPEKAPGVLTPIKIKEKLLAQNGVDCLAVIRDSAELLKLNPDEFVRNFLVDNLQPSMVVEGDDFNFGKNRSGNIKTLQKLGMENGFKVHVVDSRKITLSTGQIVRVSSTMIRYMLESGHAADACSALGRPYRLTGEIIQGRGIGRKLGFPTLNMKVPNQVIPAEGVYAGFVKLGDSIDDIFNSNESIPAAYSIGQARTYGDEFPLLIEAHLLRENIDDINNKYMAMDFIKKIRNQHKFNSPDELSEQINKDCKAAKEILGN